MFHTVLFLKLYWLQEKFYCENSSEKIGLVFHCNFTLKAKFGKMAGEGLNNYSSSLNANFEGYNL